MKEKVRNILERNQNKVFYRYKDKSITYKELLDYSLEYSDYLKRQGSSPVIIYGNKDPYVIISIISCILADRTYIPIGTCTPLFRLEKIVELTKSSLIITDSNISISGVDVTRLEDLSKYKNNSLLSIENDYVYMIFTSGSTGEPKGVPISKTNLKSFIKWISNLEPLNSYKDINVLNQASFSFDLSVADFYYSLFNGHTLYAVDTDNLEEVYNTLNNIDVAVMTPTFMRMCLLNKEFNSANYPRFKCVYFCGEMLDTKLVNKLFLVFPNLKIINAYGPTEATSAVSGILITKDMINDLLLPVGEVGRFATNIEIVDNEIVLSGDSVFNGYLGNIIGGYKKIDNINYYYTGDIGYIYDNKLYCKGRLDSQIKYKGYRIELNDIEYNINKIDKVKECCVIAKYDELGTVKSIKAFVVGSITSEKVLSSLKDMLPSYMLPKTVTILDKLPVNSNNKIDRKVLNEL